MNKNLKSVLYLLILLLLIAVVGYVIFSYAQFNGAALPLEELQGKTYFSYDGLGMFEVGENGEVSFSYQEADLKNVKAEYSENIFEVTNGEEKLHFYAIDGGKTIYSDKYRLYLHQEETEE